MTISPPALEISALDIPITIEEILADLLYPAPLTAETHVSGDMRGRGAARRI